MQRWLVLGCVGVLAACSSDGFDDRGLVGESELPIVNGNTTTGDPAVVYVSGGCTGTLISPRVVLTARHCTQTGGSKDIFFGSQTNGQGTWIPSSDIVVYTPGSGIGSGDLAVVLLSQPAPTDWIPVNDRDLGAFVGQDVRMVGFGRTSSNGGGSGTKREGMTTLQRFNNAGSVMYTGGDPSGHCFGDSGGPKFMTIDGEEIIVAVTSFVQNGCGNFGGDGSASTHTHYDWIMSYVDANDPATCDADGRCAETCGAVDPDCPCAVDGFCSDLCADLTTDPDCDGCGADGTCREDCPTLDDDCCASDGECFDACGETDPDCIDAEPTPPPGPGAGGSGGEGAPNDPGSPPPAEATPASDGGLEGSVTCSVGRSGSSTSTWLLVLGLVGLWRRRLTA